MKHSRIFLSFILFYTALMSAVFYSGSAGAAQPLVLDSNQGMLNLARNLDYIEDPEGQLSINDISAGERAGEFIKNQDDEFNIGFSRSTFWLRFRLKPPEEEGQADWFIEFGKPGIGEIDLYIPLEGGGWQVKETGENKTNTSRDVAHRSFVLKLPHNFDQDRYFYVRIKSVISINLAVTLWRPAEYTWWVVYDYYAFGIAYGIMVAMLLYNLVVFFSMDDRVYLYYVLYITFMLIHLSINYGHIPSAITFGDNSRFVIRWPVIGLSWLTAGAFCREFLNTRRVVPRFDKLILLIMFLGFLILMLGVLRLEYLCNQFNNILTPLAALTGLVVGAAAYIRGFKPAKYFLLAWIILLVGMSLYAMGGILIPRTFITRYTMVIGASLEALILSLALAERIKSLRMEKEELSKTADRLKHLSRTDGLTGLYNKRHMMSRLSREYESARTFHHPLSLIMMDIDDFKKVNDTYGHPTGDGVLCVLADLISHSARANDCPCRYGGEEFALILPGANAQNAFEVAERIRTALEKHVFEHSIGKPGAVTISLGLAELQDSENIEEFIGRSDQALYQAKREGKNRTSVYGGLRLQGELNPACPPQT